MAYTQHICTMMEDVSCIHGAAYAEQYCDPSCVYSTVIYGQVQNKWSLSVTITVPVKALEATFAFMGTVG